MTIFLKRPQANEVVELSEKITRYQCIRRSVSFIYPQSDQSKMGGIATAAALTGMDGQAASIATYVIVPGMENCP
jgi:hypothetical protein